MPDPDKPRSTFTSETLPTEGRPGYEDTVITTTTTTTDPIAVATELVESFSGVTVALEKVKGRSRTLTVLMVLVFVLFAAVGWLVWQLNEAQERACASGNNVRGGLLHVADTMEAGLLAPRPDGRERTEDEIEATRAFIDDLRDDFALRDC